MHFSEELSLPTGGILPQDSWKVMPLFPVEDDSQNWLLRVKKKKKKAQLLCIEMQQFCEVICTPEFPIESGAKITY